MMGPATTAVDADAMATMAGGMATAAVTMTVTTMTMMIDRSPRVTSVDQSASSGSRSGRTTRTNTISIRSAPVVKLSKL